MTIGKAPFGLRIFAESLRTAVALAGWMWFATPVWAGNATVAGTATASARSSHWIAVESPFTGDDNVNGYTSAKLGLSSTGPFTISTSLGKSSGPAEWRADVFGFGNVSPSTTYYIEVTYVDSDGVVGVNPQVIGPITTPAAGPNAVTVETATAVAGDTEIYVTVPILNDANQNSDGVVEIATSSSGPWTAKCGGELPMHPKRCRIRSLTPGTNYWVRATITDPDGVAGSNPQILGPILFSGFQNLALGKSISADPGWGCCPSPSQLVDGRIQNPAWYYGFAWTGGTSCWAGGCPPGFKQATVDLGSPTAFNRGIVWYHDPGSVPVVWKFQHSNDGTTWTDDYSNTAPVCRTATDPLYGAWYHPGCGHDAKFPQVTARYFRYTFDDSTLFGGIHGWAVEIEVYNGAVALTVAIDIKPGSFPNSINPESHGTIPVAILSSSTLDAPASVDRTSVTFGRTGNEQSLAFCNSSPQDLNSDGFLDLLCHFNTQQTGFQSGDTVGVLKGKTITGTPIIGTDSVRIVP